MKTQTPTQPEINGSYVTPDGKAQIDFGITYRNGYPEFHASGYFNGSSGQCIAEIDNAYPEDGKIAELVSFWKRYHIKSMEGKPALVSYVALMATQHPALSFYDIQATQFLTSNGLKLRATLSDTKTPAWSKGEKHGHHYRVTLSRIDKENAWEGVTAKMLGLDSPRRLTFDFWGSIANAESGKAPTPYDILVCISSGACTPETFEDFCSEYGYDSDSLNALQTFRRCNTFAKRLRAFFTPAELNQLSEIQ